MGRPQVSVVKRQREQARRERQQAKAEKRAQRKNEKAIGAPDSADEFEYQDGTAPDQEPAV